MGRILIVDDEESDRLFERSILEDEGHQLYFAQDGEVALKVYRDHDVELVVTDLHMPRLDGFRLIEELKELDPDVVVVAVSGIAAAKTGRAQELGARETLYKPVDPELLVKAVREGLEARYQDPWDGRKL